MIESKQPKILFLDIETSPNLAWVWAKYDQDVIRFEQEWYILCYSVKWLGQKQIITKSLPDFPLYKKQPTSDKFLVQSLWNYLDEADIVVAHNGDEFDIKKINARFIINNLTPPSPFKSIDTYKIAKKYFGFTSNKLNDLASNFAIKSKISVGFNTWLGCIKGDMAAWKQMVTYNKRDIEILEQAYLKLRPWSSSHPNLSIYLQNQVCPKCGSNKIQSRGYYTNKTTVYTRFQCQGCGSWSRAYNREKSNLKPMISV